MKTIKDVNKILSKKLISQLATKTRKTLSIEIAKMFMVVLDCVVMQMSDAKKSCLLNSVTSFLHHSGLRFQSSSESLFMW